MLEYAEVHRLLKSPLALEIEERMVRNMRLKRKRGFRTTFSFKCFIELLARDLTFEEIGRGFGLPSDAISMYYKNYAQALFCGETGLARRNRIAAQRRQKKIDELLATPITDPLLLEIAELARSKGCKVTAYVTGANSEDKLRVSSNAIYIDGKSCYVHRLNHQHVQRTYTAAVSYIQFSLSVLEDYDIRIICARLPGRGARNFVVPSFLIRRKLFADSETVERKSVSITFNLRARGSGTLDLRPYHNQFEAIKYY